jgi:hypothetical protein
LHFLYAVTHAPDIGSETLNKKARTVTSSNYDFGDGLVLMSRIVSPGRAPLPGAAKGLIVVLQ